jgi:hypothetical protein
LLGAMVSEAFGLCATGLSNVHGRLPQRVLRSPRRGLGDTGRHLEFHCVVGSGSQLLAKIRLEMVIPKTG